MKASPMAGWERDLERWLEPVVAGLRREQPRCWAAVPLERLILRGERKHHLSNLPTAHRMLPVTLTVAGQCWTFDGRGLPVRESAPPDPRFDHTRPLA